MANASGHQRQTGKDSRTEHCTKQGQLDGLGLPNIYTLSAKAQSTVVGHIEERRGELPLHGQRRIHCASGGVKRRQYRVASHIDHPPAVSIDLVSEDRPPDV